MRFFQKGFLKIIALLGVTSAVAGLGPLTMPTRALAQDETIPIIDVSKIPRPPIVAVPDFRPMNDMSRGDDAGFRLGRSTRETIDFTGLCEVADPALYPTSMASGTEAEDFSAWKALGAEYLIRGDFERLDGGRYKVEFRLFDVRLQKMELGKRYTGERDALDRMVMKFMDEFIGFLRPGNKKGALDSKIAYITDKSGRSEVHMMDTDGSHDTAITSNHTLNVSPAWSHDGKYLLYTSYRARNPDLYIRDVYKGSEIKFFSARGLNTAGEFSPDGSRVAFSREGDDGNIDIYIIGVNGKGLKRVTTSSAIEVSPTWSPDGNFMAFVSDRTGRPQIYLLDLRQGAEGTSNPAVRLTYQGDYNTSPAWSPDGRKLAYTGRTGGQFDLYLIIMEASDRPVKRITQTMANEENPSWSPDGLFLVYDSNRYGNYDIYIISIYKKVPRRLTTGSAKDRMATWSPKVN